MYVYTLYAHPFFNEPFHIEANSEKPAETAVQTRGFLARELSTLGPPFHNYIRRRPSPLFLFFSGKIR